MVWMSVVCVILVMLVVMLSVKVYLMRKVAAEITAQLSEKLNQDTNTLLFISSNDRVMRRLAASLNVQLIELRKQRYRFVQGDMELKNAVTNISHDLRTPLTAISGYMDLLEQEEKSDAAKRYLAVIRERTELMRQLTEELFRYSVITSTEGDRTETEEVSVNEVLEESIAEHYAKLQAADIMPKIQIPEKKVLRKLNRISLSRIFSNLLSNAIKYSDGDLEIVLTEEGEVIFSNRASGLSPAAVERLFDRFYTLESARKSTGLGLTIAKTLVGEMGGTITADYEKERLSIRIRFF